MLAELCHKRFELFGVITVGGTRVGLENGEAFVAAHRTRLLAIEDAAMTVAESAAVASGVVLGCVVIILGVFLLGLRSLLGACYGARR
jgi:hypothetical protein